MVIDRSATWDYRVILGQGATSLAANGLTSTRLVLPFLFTSVGGPVFFAGLLVPIFTIVKISVQIFVAPFISAARNDKLFLVIAGLAPAAALALICLTVNKVQPGALVAIFLLSAAILGSASGVGSLGYMTMLGKRLPRDKRSQLLFVQASLAGIFTVIVAFAAQRIQPPGAPLAAHLELVWLGVCLYVVAAMVALLISDGSAAAPGADGVGRSDHLGRSLDIKGSFQIAFALPWFREFLVARTLFLSIELAMPFFSVHAATYHGGNNNSLSTFVIASSLGLILGGVLWPPIAKYSVRLLFVIASGSVCAGGLLALAIELGVASQSVLVYAIVFVLVSLGAGGVVNGRSIYLIGMTSDEERPYCLAVASLTIGLGAVGFGAVLGALASFQNVAWPIVVLVVLAAVAGLFALRLKGGQTRHAEYHNHDGPHDQ